MADSRQLLLDKLFDTLHDTHCPPHIIDTLRHGFVCWQSQSPSTSAPLAGQLGNLATILTTAFHEKFHSLSWHQLCLGRLSKKWATAYSIATGTRDPLPGK